MVTESVLLTYQQRWVADDSPVKICEKSRRVGLSWGEASKSALEAAKGVGGQDTWYIGYNKDMAEEFILDVAFWAKHYQCAAEAMEEEVIADERGDILTFKIRFASGNRVTALSSRPSNLRGKQGRVIIDEAAFHPDLLELIKAAVALTIWGGSVSIISTHNGVDNAFNELVNDVRAGKKPYSLHRITFDEAIEQGLCKRVFRSTKRAWSEQAQAEWCEGIRALYRPNDAEELDCIPAQSGGAYMSRALIESRMSAECTVVRLVCPPGFEQQSDGWRTAHVKGWIDEHLAPLVAALSPTFRSSVGMDFGRSGDLSVIFPLVEQQALLRAAPFSIEMRNVPFKQQEQVLFWLCDHLPRFAFGALDARGNGQYLAEVAMQRYGAMCIAQVMLSNPWYLENFPKLKAAFEDGTLAAIPKDADQLDDLRAVVMDKGIPKIADGKGKGADGGQRHGDAAVALCLAWFASGQAGGAIEYTPVGKSEGGRHLDKGSGQIGRFRMRPNPMADVPNLESERSW
jgi:phage FluMu gp28-like protein